VSNGLLIRTWCFVLVVIHEKVLDLVDCDSLPSVQVSRDLERAVKQ